MPRRDGEVFFRGTAMALFSLNYLAARRAPKMPDGFGSRAYNRSRGSTLGGRCPLPPPGPHTGVERRRDRHPALVDSGQARQGGRWRPGVAPARVRQHRGEQRRLAGVEIARRLVEGAPGAGLGAELAVRAPFHDIEVDLELAAL